MILFLSACGSLSTSKVTSPRVLTEILISQPISAVPVGLTQQLTATGKYTDGSLQDMTSNVVWSTSQSAIAVVGNNGTVKALAIGTTKIKAASGPVSAEVSLTVSAAVLSGITISTQSTSLVLGTSSQLTAIGRLSDGTTQDLTQMVAWSSAAPNIIAINNSGLAKAMAMGSGQVTASLGSISGTDRLNVTTAALLSIAVVPNLAAVLLGATQQLAATGTFSDGSRQDLTASATWSSDQPDIALFRTPGVVFAQHVGTAGITASSGAIQGSATLVVSPLMLMTYFDSPGTSGTTLDSTLRLINTGFSEGGLCAMIYVFDKSEELNECCGCSISADGLRILSIPRDLTSNPLTGIRPKSGVIKVFGADAASNPSCDAGSPTPAGEIKGWATHIQNLGGGAFAPTEAEALSSPLSPAEQSVLQGQCAFLKKLGSGQGICSCGSGS